MFAPAIRVLTGRAAALIAIVCAVILALVLGLTVQAAERTRLRLQARVDTLSQQLAVTLAAQKVQTAACGHASSATATAAGAREDPARRLMQPPPGFDVCARMESADQAVLDSLG